MPQEVQARDPDTVKVPPFTGRGKTRTSFNNSDTFTLKMSAVWTGGHKTSVTILIPLGEDAPKISHMRNKSLNQNFITQLLAAQERTIKTKVKSYLKSRSDSIYHGA